SRTACRSEPAPLSARLSTVKVLGTVRSSSASMLNRTAARLRSRVFSVPDVTSGERADRSQDDRRMAITPWEDLVCNTRRDIVPGPQTERQGGAGPVRGLLGGKASPAAAVKSQNHVTSGCDYVAFLGR